MATNTLYVLWHLWRNSQRMSTSKIWKQIFLSKPLESTEEHLWLHSNSGPFFLHVKCRKKCNIYYYSAVQQLLWAQTRQMLLSNTLKLTGSKGKWKELMFYRHLSFLEEKILKWLLISSAIFFCIAELYLGSKTENLLGKHNQAIISLHCFSYVFNH